MKKPPEPESFFRRNARGLLGAAILALLLHDVFGPHGVLAMRRTQKQIELLRADIQKLNQENQDLSQQVQALKTDPKMIEKLAREQMGLARPGEYIFKLPPPPNPGNPAKPHTPR